MNTELVIRLAGTRLSRFLWLRFRITEIVKGEGKDFSEQEIHFLIYTIMDFCECPPEQLGRKISSSAKQIKELFALVPSLLGKDNKTKIWCRIKLNTSLSELILPNYEYYGLKYSKPRILETNPSELLKVRIFEKRRYPDPKYIGVGYRDKGSAKKPAEDGTFSWEYYAQFTDEEEEVDNSLSSLLTKEIQKTSLKEIAKKLSLRKEVPEKRKDASEE